MKLLKHRHYVLVPRFSWLQHDLEAILKVFHRGEKALKFSLTLDQNNGTFQFWFIMESYGSNLGYSQLYRYLLVNYICCKVPEY